MASVTVILRVLAGLFKFWVSSNPEILEIEIAPEILEISWDLVDACGKLYN